jgi:hypothetical protein
LSSIHAACSIAPTGSKALADPSLGAAAVPGSSMLPPAPHADRVQHVRARGTRDHVRARDERAVVLFGRRREECRERLDVRVLSGGIAQIRHVVQCRLEVREVGR